MNGMGSNRVLIGHVPKCYGKRQPSIRNRLHQEPWSLSAKENILRKSVITARRGEKKQKPKRTMNQQIEK